MDVTSVNIKSNDLTLRQEIGGGTSRRHKEFWDTGRHGKIYLRRCVETNACYLRTGNQSCGKV